MDISKQTTRFCTTSRIEPEADKLFSRLAILNYFEGLSRLSLIGEAAIFYADLNVIHPFREGNGRAQRILFEHLIVNCGYQISWEHIGQDEWLQANIDGYNGEYAGMTRLFERSIGQLLADEFGT
ncbi:Fic family protein [Andreprevotia sp. IGB-42]|uniref:Fic/DOC family protein n=1 Tax=Andreprevotia sp. IGB-42 TaxID=2497473 RepID=UPI0019200EA9